MNELTFASVRLGKTSVEAIKNLNSQPQGVVEPFTIEVVCTQVPQEFDEGVYVFVWLGSDNSKGMPTDWKQGYKAFGIVESVVHGEHYNDESTSILKILYVFPNSVNRLDFLKFAPEAYYFCSALPIIGLDDHSNQTIRLILTEGERGNINSMFYALRTITDSFYSSLIQIDSMLQNFFDFVPPSKKKGLNSSKSHLSINNHYFPYLTAIRTKPFLLLAGISGTGKSRIVRKLAQATTTEELQKKYGKTYEGKDFDEERWNIHSPENFQLIQVKPNWHNSMDVVGYLSNIPSPHYVFTPFINFIVKAWRNPGIPFFLCLDEMNLAPVEEYFAEFLSAIESRSKKNGKYQTDPIIKPFNEFGDKMSDKMIDDLFPDFKAHEADERLLKLKKLFKEQGLTLPENLIVIGTVNMDETTFSFSRKVLDRAMSIEMNDVNYDDFLAATTDDGLRAIVEAFSKEDGASLNELLTHRHIEAKEIIGNLGGDEGDSDAKFAVGYLKQVNSLLEGTPFKLGYRAANEALIYLDSTRAFGISDRNAALDDFTLMKILSRIEGDESKLKITSSESDKRRLQESGVSADEASKYGDLTILTAMREIVKRNLGESAKSIAKIDQMISMLARDHFVSYWN